jgi:hypothetical protein
VPIGITVILTIRISYRYSGTYSTRRTYKVETAAVNNTFIPIKPNESTDRIIKDIRYYEIKPKDFTGDFNGIMVMLPNY